MGTNSVCYQSTTYYIWLVQTKIDKSVFLLINLITFRVILFIEINSRDDDIVTKRVIYNIYDLDETSMANLVKISKKIINTDYDLIKSTHHAPV